MPLRAVTIAPRALEPPRAADRHRAAAHPAVVAAALVVAALALSRRLRRLGPGPVGLGHSRRADRPAAGRRDSRATRCCSQVLAVPLCVALALALAWLTERSDLPRPRPVALARRRAARDPGLRPGLCAGTAPSRCCAASGRRSAISVLAYFPLVYLPVIAQLRRLDPAAEEVAATLGNAPARVFLTVVLPQLRLAILGGGLLIALHLLAEYGLYVLIRYDTLTVAIVNQFQAVYDGPAANLMGIVLVACAVGVLALEAWLRGDRRYARVGSGAARAAPLAKLGRTAALDAAADR